MLRLGIETSSTIFNSAGTARYCLELLKALRAEQADDVELIEIKPFQRLRVTQPGLARKLFVLYWERIYCPFLLPQRVRQLDLDLLHCTAHAATLQTATPVGAR